MSFNIQNNKKATVIVSIIVAIIILSGVTYAAYLKIGNVNDKIEKTNLSNTNKKLPVNFTNNDQAAINSDDKQPIVSNENTSDWQVYKNEKLGYELKYPSEWILEKQKDNKILFKNEIGETVIFIGTYLYNLDYDYENTIEKAIKGNVRDGYMGAQEPKNLIMEKIIDDKNTIGYFSQWQITALGKEYSEARADFESKKENPLTTETGRYKTVIFLKIQPDFTDRSMIDLIISTFKFLDSPIGF